MINNLADVLTILETDYKILYVKDTVKVRVLFDPPSNGTLMQALNEQAKELEVRLYTECGGY